MQVSSGKEEKSSPEMLAEKSRDSFDRAGLLLLGTFFYESAAQLLYMHVSDMEDYAMVLLGDYHETRTLPSLAGRKKEGKDLIQSGGYYCKFLAHYSVQDPRLQLAKEYGERGKRSASPAYINCMHSM